MALTPSAKRSKLEQDLSSDESIETVPRGRLTDFAYEWLEEAIVTLKIEPGQTLSELQICEMSGFGRTPVREAIQRLSREQLITVLPQRGLLVPDIDVAKQLRLLEARREVERLIARGAARKATIHQRAEFKKLAKDFKAASKNSDEVEFVRADRYFNELCLSAAKNEFADGAMRLMHGLSRRFWYYHREAEDLSQMAKLHSDVAEAISIGDVVAAESASDILMDYIEHFAKNTVLGEGRN